MISTGYYQQGIDLGLLKTKDGVNYDTFRSRIIFPIVDHNGRTVGFGARALKADEVNAKYINSSESKIFNKSRVLFGLHFAAQEIRKKGYANLMEGYTDVISFHQAGQINTVGTCGTALTDDQVKILRKYTNKVVLIYDPDEAGQGAAARSINLLNRHGFQTSIVPLPSIVQLKNGWRETVFITTRTKESMF
jgi:DNA primase